MSDNTTSNNTTTSNTTTDTALPAPGSLDLDHATLDQLEAMLKQAEENLQAIYSEIEHRRRDQLEAQYSQLPDDMSSFKGSWRNLVSAFRQVAHRKDSEQAAE